MNELCNHAVIVFAYIIRGEGEMSGLQFGDRIRKTYDCESNNANKKLVEQVEKHIVKIRYDFNGRISLTYK